MNSRLNLRFVSSEVGGVRVSIPKCLSTSFLILATAVSVATQRSNAQSAIELGNKLVAEGKYEQAIREYKRVVDGDGEKYATAVYNIGVCYYQLWRTEEAIELYKRAVKLRHGHYPKASFALGIALEEQNRFAEAKEAYRQSIRTSRDENPWAKFKLGLLEANDGHLDSAARLFGEASAGSGEHVAPSHNNLGVMLARMGRLSDAEKEFAVALRQTNGEFLEAEQNLKLCRSLLATAQNRDALSNLKLKLATMNFY
jgi:tetratricopeptide (TPR) repeat protein